MRKRNINGNGLSLLLYVTYLICSAYYLKGNIVNPPVEDVEAYVEYYFSFIYFANASLFFLVLLWSFSDSVPKMSISRLLFYSLSICTLLFGYIWEIIYGHPNILWN